jgi:hypothetical protein
MSEKSEFWWYKYGSMNTLKSQLVVGEPLKWFGVAFLLISHFAIDGFTWLFISLGLLIILSKTISTYRMYSDLEKRVNNNDN